MGKVRSFLNRLFRKDDFVSNKMTQREENLYQNLNEQIEKIYRTNKRQSRSVKERFKGGCQDFAKHLAKEYGSQKFKNIRDQHLISYVNASAERGLSKSAIETNLAAIRKMHELMPKKKHEFAIKNKDLNIPQAEKNSQNTDRAWTDNEYRKALETAQQMKRDDIENSMQLSYNFGLRIEEATALHTNQLENSLKQGYIELHNTKNGIERDVPVETPHQIGVIQKILAKKRIQDWIINNRSKFQNDKQFNVNDTREKSNLTFHGLRHSYTRTNYEKNIHEGMNKKESRKDVARNLGHGRDSVTLTYL